MEIFTNLNRDQVLVNIRPAMEEVREFTAAERKFDAAVQVIKRLPKNGSFEPSHELMLQFYAYYKQATVGKCQIAKPAFYDVVGKAKWEAWKKLEDMPKEMAMISYVDELKKIIEAMPHTNEVSQFINSLGSFYEIVEDPPVAKEDVGNGLVAKKFAREACDTNCHLNKGKSANRNSNNKFDGQHSSASEDSDGEEFCDSTDQVHMGNISQGNSESSNGEMSSSEYEHVTLEGEQVSEQEEQCDKEYGGGDKQAQKHVMWSQPVSSRIAASRPVVSESVSRVFQLEGAGASGGRPPRDGKSGIGVGVNDQIATTLVRLQQDMNMILSRLNSLEALTLHITSQRAGPAWWPVQGPHLQVIIFMIIWPFVAQFLWRFISIRFRWHRR